MFKNFSLQKKLFGKLAKLVFWSFLSSEIEVYKIVQLFWIYFFNESPKRKSKTEKSRLSFPPKLKLKKHSSKMKVKASVVYIPNFVLY